MVLSREQLRYMRETGRMHVLCFGGDSSSAQTTKNTDARVVGGDSSVNLSTNGDGNAINLTTTDHGAITAGAAIAHDSLQLAMAGTEAAQQTTQTAITSSGHLLENALATQAQLAGTIKDVRTGDNQVLVIAGLAVVGLAVAMTLGRH